jgi:DNA-binding NarL/FixJ family response regulator
MAFTTEPVSSTPVPAPTPTAAQVPAAAQVLIFSEDLGLRRRLQGVLDISHAESLPIPVDLESVLTGEWDGEAILVLACDVNMPRDVAVLRRLRRQRRTPRIIAVSPATTGTGVRRGLDAGADAIVFEDELDLTLAVAVSAVASGQSVVPRNLRAGMERPAFSHRERQVLSCVARGLTNAQIAEELYLAESTIKSHLSSAFSKFGVRSRKEAAALFLETEHPGAIN